MCANGKDGQSYLLMYVSCIRVIYEVDDPLPTYTSFILPQLQSSLPVADWCILSGSSNRSHPVASAGARSLDHLSTPPLDCRQGNLSHGVSGKLELL